MKGSSTTVLSVEGERGSGNRVANLDDNTCTCRLWDEYQRPCVFVSAILDYRNNRNTKTSRNQPSDYACELFLHETLREIYHESIIPVDASGWSRLCPLQCIGELSALFGEML